MSTEPLSLPSSSSSSATSAPDAEPQAPATASEPEAPLTSLLASGSHDDHFLRSPHSHRVAPDLKDSSFQLPTVSEGGPEPELGSDPAASPFTAINTSAPAPPPAPAAGTSASPSGAGTASDDEDDEPDARTSWPVVILGSYSSAVTLALVWVLLHPRVREPDPVPFTSAAVAPTESERSATGGSPKAEPPAPLPADRVARLGQMLRVGALEFTPLDARRQDVTLRRVAVGGSGKSRPGLAGTVVLRVRLRNVSSDQVFAPLEPGFVRPKGAESSPTFAEAPGATRVDLYPLAIESEMGIVGQDFGDLRPGETREVAIVTAPIPASETPAVDPARLSWRIRLRTGVERVESVGVSPAGPG